MSSRTLMQAIVIGGLGLLLATPASAATIVAVAEGGITNLVYDTDNAGSFADPWTVNEVMSAAGTIAFTTEEGSALGPDNPTASGHSYGKWLQKTILNDTGTAWTSFELELQVILGTPSLDGDGLSFAQGAVFTFTSDRFGVYSAIEDIRDYLNFSSGVVNPGETVTFMIAMTDNSLRENFYLLQTPNKEEVNPVPEPASLLLLGTGLVGAASRKLRKSK